MADSQNHKRPKVAIYCRLSDEDRRKKDPRDESRSIQTQKAMLRDYALKENWEIYDIYSDDDYSGADSSRPEYNRLLEDAKEKRFDIVLCKHQSRFTRDMAHVQKYINEKFEEWGIRYISLLDGADTFAYGNKKSRQINGLVNEWYLEDLSENVRRACITRKKEGKYLASCVVFGYARDPNDNYHLVIDEPSARVVRRIFKEYIEGKSLTAIAAGLNRDGILSPTRYKIEVQGINFKGTENLRMNKRYQGQSLWHGSSVNRILKNEVYIGNLCQNKCKTISYKNHRRVLLPREEWIVVENTHEPIISKEDFYTAAYGAKKRARIFKRTGSHLFTGKLVCGKCGSAMHSNCIRGDNVYYRCSLAKELKECSGMCVSQNLIIDECIREINCIIKDLIVKEDIEHIISSLEVELEKDIKEAININELERMICDKKNRLSDLMKRKLRSYEDMLEGIITADDYGEFSFFYSRQMEGLRIELEKNKKEYLRKKELEVLLQGEARKIKETIKNITKGFFLVNELTEEMVRMFIDYVEVLDGGKKGVKRLKIHWNF